MTSTRSSKWVLFSALQREGRRMSVWLALFPFLGFLYALCHGLLQALMNQDTDTVAAQDQTVRIFGSIALFLSAATIMAGAFFAISAFRFLYSRRLFAPGTDFLCRAVSRFPVRAEPAASTDCGTGQPYRVCALWGAGSV